MIVIQRIRVVWYPEARGAAHAGLRRGLSDPRPLPEPLPTDPVVVHDLAADGRQGYQPSAQVLTGSDAAASASLRLTETGQGVTVHVHARWAVFPRQARPVRLFAVPPGGVALYRANFRYRGHCPCTASWWYEDWTVRVANAPARAGLFLDRDPEQVVDHRTQLYGGRRRAR